MARTNGGLIGKRNITSFGKDTVTVKTSDGAVTTQSGTRLVNTLVVAGGGAGGCASGGGGGAGGAQVATCISVCGSSPYPMTVGGGGSAISSAGRGGNGSNSVAGFPSNPITSTGGGGGGGVPGYTSGNPGG